MFLGIFLKISLSTRGEMYYCRGKFMEMDTKAALLMLKKFLVSVKTLGDVLLCIKIGKFTRGRKI